MPGIQKGRVTSAAKATARAMLRVLGMPLMRRSCDMPAEQALRPEDQHQQHRQEQHEVGKLGQERLAEVIDEADDDAADEGAEQAAGAAEYDDDQSQRQ